MSHTLLIVEGAHDTAFLGHLLRNRGYRRAKTKSEVPEFWQKLIPSKYPVDDKENLDRVIRFPEVYIKNNGDNTVGICPAGSDSKLIPELGSIIEHLSAKRFFGIGVFADVDYKESPTKRFDGFCGEVSKLNDAAASEGNTDGFPLAIPMAPGVVLPGPPKFGIFLFPDNCSPGLLEDVLLAGAKSAIPDIHQVAESAIAEIDKALAPGHKAAKELRGASGRQKACAGVIATVLKPGKSLAVAIQDKSQFWLPPASLTAPPVSQVDAFLNQLLP